MAGAWAWIRGAFAAVLITGAVGVGVVVYGPQPLVLSARAAPVEIADLTTPTLEQLVLPTPTRPPENPHAAVPVTPIGRITIPAIGVDRTMYEGIWETVIDVGPGHWPGTAEPGGWGNTVIAAHRVSHGGPFRRIAELRAGDQIILTTTAGTFTYEVTGSSVVAPTAMWIVDQHPGRTITLFACHPPGSATERYVVTGKLVSS
jgi:LPXTG-site transpeptidase (sortase) family protein